MEQLRNYAAQMEEIDQAMNCLGHAGGDAGRTRSTGRPEIGLTMGGWYAATGLYLPEELGGLSVRRFCQALVAEGVPCGPGCNKALHLHPLFNTVDVYGQGKPNAKSR